MRISVLATITFGLLMLSLVALWIPKRTTYNIYKGVNLWIILFVFSVCFGIYAKFINIVALISIILFYTSCKIFGELSHSQRIRSISAVFILVLSIGAITHFIPGFSNPKIVSNLILTEGAVPYSLYLNFDKPLVGLFILAFCHERISSKNGWITMLKETSFRGLLVVLFVMITALTINYVRFDLKFSSLFPVWIWINLLFTCTAEEAFFRGFLQKYAVSFFKKIRYGSLLGILLTSLLFGFAHYTGGINLIFLATIAGLGYGWIYHSTKTIESSILTHFFLNLIHFIFFTYPALA